MASTSGTAAVEDRGRGERKRKRGATGEHGEWPEAEPSKWRTRRVHEIYSSKLLDAIRLVRSGSPSASSSSAAAAPQSSRAMREAADRALAVSARGRTRWSRAILASHRRRIQAARRARLRDRTSPASSRHPSSSSTSSGKGSKAPALARKAKVLGRLVPGCRKLPFPALLAEASDYIAALEMQVRAMTALAEVLSTVSASSSGGSSSPA